MSTYTSITDLVNDHVTYEHHFNPNDWNKCYCEVCGDGSRTKGPRGGWSFQGEMAFYSCFNCGIKASYDPNRDFPICRDMRRVLEAFGISIKEARFIADKNKFIDKPVEEESSDSEEAVVKPVINLYVKSYDSPDYFVPLSTLPDSNVYAEQARAMLWDKYGLKDTSYPFMLSSGLTKSPDPKEKSMAKMLMGRIIIPFYKNGGLIYYQARAMEEDEPKRYINMQVPKTNIIFNMDAMYRNHERPLYIFEGAMDAIHVDGVAVMENNLSASQVELLNRCYRKKVIVPDINQDKAAAGDNKLIQIGVYENGWGVALPELGSGNKDLSEGIKRYGKLFILQSLVQNTYYGQEAQLQASFLNY